MTGALGGPRQLNHVREHGCGEPWPPGGPLSRCGSGTEAIRLTAAHRAGPWGLPLPRCRRRRLPAHLPGGSRCPAVLPEQVPRQVCRRHRSEVAQVRWALGEAVPTVQGLCQLSPQSKMLHAPPPHPPPPRPSPPPRPAPPMPPPPLRNAGYRFIRAMWCSTTCS